ncbi:MAG: D-alanyl-D-alanine carboxypeptidase family protein [bacterium]
MYRTALISFIFTLLSSVVTAAPIPAPPQVTGTGHLLVDVDSGHVIAESNSDKRLEPASLTKIMTAYVVFRELREGNLKLDEMVRISEKAWKTPGSRMFIEVNTQVSVDDLINGMIIQSGNDACVALAEHIAGSEDTFAAMMNENATRLGMTHTNFMNATGLPDDNHYTTPEDIVKVTVATQREFPELYKRYAIKDFTYNDIKQPNRNKLLWRDKSVDGVKTGHTEAAGYCLVASARRNDMQLVSVVMGTESEAARAKASEALLNYGFRFFETHQLYDAGQQLKKIRIWKGETEQLGLGIAKDLHLTVPRKQYKNLSAKTVVKEPIEAPVRKGQPIGRLVISLNGEVLADEPLVALQTVPEGGFFSTMVDSVLLMME